MAPFHAAKAAIREECLPHQDLYEPDFNTLLHALTMEMFPYFNFLFVLGETYQFLDSSRLGGMVSSACAI